MKITVSAVRRPEGGRKGRNGAEVVLLGPTTVDVPANVPSLHEAPPQLAPYSFAFWWVGGTAAGNFVTLTNQVSIPPGTTDVVAKAYMFRTVVTPPAGTGVFVDAFDIHEGRFLDDDFVAVSGPNNQVDPLLTAGANTSGFVPTDVTHSVDVFATIGADQFDHLACLRGQEPIMGGKLTALQESNGEAVAFYTGASKPALLDASRMFVAGTWVSWGVTVDGGGPTGAGPVPPWTPLTLDVAAGFALAEAAGKLYPALRAEVLKIAARQIGIATKAIGKALDGAAKLSGTGS